jgi:hypothetical protein
MKAAASTPAAMTTFGSLGHAPDFARDFAQITTSVKAS